VRRRTAPPVAFPKRDAGPTNTLALPRSRRDLSGQRKEGMRSSTLMVGTVALGRVITAWLSSLRALSSNVRAISAAKSAVRGGFEGA
jgi:hypothetical protein